MPYTAAGSVKCVIIRSASIAFLMKKPPNKRFQPTAFGAGMRGESCQSRRRLKREPLARFYPAIGGFRDVSLDQEAGK